MVERGCGNHRGPAGGLTRPGTLMRNCVVALLLFGGLACAGTGPEERASRYLIDLTRIDSTNPPGGETAVARYLERVATEEGIPCELLGPDPARLNFVGKRG